MKTFFGCLGIWALIGFLAVACVFSVAVNVFGLRFNVTL